MGEAELRFDPTSHHPQPTDVDADAGPTIADVMAMPPVIDIVAAGKVLGFGRSKAYELARRRKFPCRVIHAGRTYVVPTAELLRLLGVEPRDVVTESNSPQETS
ncbi:MAG: hypothetical protein ACRD0P_24410 [Stackebrandtia sp.]